MTLYAATAAINGSVSSAGGGTFAQSMAIQNSTSFTLRLNRIDLYANSPTTTSYSSVVSISRYESSTISAGTLWSALPMRQGAAASGVVVRGRQATYNGTAYAQGTAVTITGTQVLLANKVEFNTADSITFPGDVLISPGSALYVASSGANSTQSGGTPHLFYHLVVFYEELHLARST